MTTTSMSMAMALATSNPTSPISSPIDTASATSMSGMAMEGSANCKVSMLWNWYTIDACFLSPKGHITSNRMFAGFCIGVVGLVLFLEFLRRLQREYDRLIQPQQHLTSMNDGTRASNPSKMDGNGSTNCNDRVNTERRLHPALQVLGISRQNSPLGESGNVPTLRQQLVRAVIYTMQFAVAYIIMFLAMYFNGYVIVCIFLGVFMGFMIFSWDASGVTSITSSEHAAFCH